MTEELRRPPAVTLACAGAAFAAFLVLTSTIGLLADWGSLELQEVVTDVIEEAGLAGSLSLDTALAWLQGWFYVVLVLAIAVLVLAVYTARGDRQSRIGLTVLSAFGGVVGAMFGAILPAIVLIAATFMLWWPEARVWFELTNGRTPSPQLVARARARQGLGPERGRDSDVDALTGRAPLPPQAEHVQPGAAPPRVSGVTPPPPGHPHSYASQPRQEWGPPLHVVPRPRSLPGTLIGAAVTMIAASLVTAFFTGSLALLLVMREFAPGAYDEALAGRRDPLQDLAPALTTGDGGIAVATLVLSVFTLAALVAVGVGIALLLGQRRAVVMALGLTAFGAAGSALVAWSYPTVLLITVAAVVTYVLLRHPSVRAWAGR